MLNTITCRQFNYVIIPSNSRGQCVFGGRNNLIKTGPGFSVRLSQQKSLSNLSWLYQALLPFAFNVWRVTKTSEHESLKVLFNPHWLWNCWCSGYDTVGAVVVTLLVNGLGWRSWGTVGAVVVTLSVLGFGTIVDAVVVALLVQWLWHCWCSVCSTVCTVFVALLVKWWLLAP